MGKQRQFGAALADFGQTAGRDITPTPAQDMAAGLQLTDRQAEGLQAVRDSRKERGQEPAPRKNRATFIVPKDTVQKLQYIGILTGKRITQVVAEAFGAYIAEFEARRGTINLQQD